MSFAPSASTKPTQEASQSSSELLSHDVALQFSQLRQPANVPSGIYLSPTNSPTTFNGVLFVHKGYYAGAIFRFQLRYLSSTRAPEITMDESCAHPLIDPRTRRLLLASRFPTWRPRQDLLFHVLSFVKSIFKRRVLDNLTDGQVAHAELLRIYRTDRPTFTRMASQSAASSQSSAKLHSAPSRSSASTGATADTNSVTANPSFLGPRFEKLKEEEYDALVKRILP